MIPRLRLRILLLALAILSAVNCSQEEAPAPTSGPSPTDNAARPPAAPVEAGPSLGGCVWEVELVNGAPLDLPEGARVPTIQFDTAAKTANGFAGCNTFSGGYRDSGETIKLGPFATTRRACGALDAVEHAYLAALGQSLSYRVTEESLEFLDGDGTVLARFKPRKY